jgi:ADP-dependent NAD(P)H-hydrate dehydratase / NAD(P)H-hydrate epimerase
MRPVLTAAEAAELEREAEARGTSVSALMERAGTAVAHAAVELAGGAYGRRAVVVCGKGNNGGDGMVAARSLAAWGVRPAVVLMADPSELAGPAAESFRALRAAGVPWSGFDGTRLRRELDRADVAVDAIFGTGLRGAPREPHAAAISALGGSDLPVVAVDVPSGVESDTGAVHGASVRASVMVALGAPKVGNVLPPGAAHGGRLRIVNIGFPEELVSGPGPWDVALLERGDAPLPLPRGPEANKREAVVLAVGGSAGMAGAPRLVALGAYRAGAGLVTLGVPEGILGIVQSSLVEATFVSLPQGAEGALGGGAWEALAPSAERADAVAIGPGLTTDGDAPSVVSGVVRECPVPLVVDADALNAFAGRPSALADRRAPAVLTPHEGELARLLGCSVADVRGDRIAMARKAATEANAAVLLKGWRTVVVRPDGRAHVVGTGTPVLATGGSGDVLTGTIAAFAARGMEIFEAAVGAAYVHGVAGRIAGARTGEGSLACDVAASIPEALEVVREGRA